MTLLSFALLVSCWAAGLDRCVAFENAILSAVRPHSSLSPKRCTYSRAHNMMGADCIGLQLVHIPSVLRTDIQILDATYNRIRELHNSSFINYPSLKYLYLTDNIISTIDSGAFDPLGDLEVLDLTLNALHFVPDALLSLPVLRKLSMSNNPFVLVNFTGALFSVNSLALSGCKLKRLPHLSSFPALQHLNVSNNKLQSVDIHQLAPMCRLNELDLRGNVPLFRQEHCNCQLLTTWVSNRSIKVWPDSSDLCRQTNQKNEVIEDSDYCITNETKLVLEESNRILRSCEAEVLQYGSGPLRLRSSVIWTLAAVCFCCVILVCFFSLYCIRKKQKNHETDSSNKRLTHADSSQS